MEKILLSKAFIDDVNKGERLLLEELCIEQLKYPKQSLGYLHYNVVTQAVYTLNEHGYLLDNNNNITRKESMLNKENEHRFDTTISFTEQSNKYIQISTREQSINKKRFIHIVVTYKLDKIPCMNGSRNDRTETMIETKDATDDNLKFQLTMLLYEILYK